MMTRDSVFQARVKRVLGRIAAQFPSLITHIDAWRHISLTDDPNTYADQDPVAWVQLANNVEVFILDQKERWWQDEIGVINKVTRYILLPAGLGLVPDDILIIQGVAWVVTEGVEQMGVLKLTVSREQANFTNPGRFAPVYRIVTVGARIA